MIAHLTDDTLSAHIDGALDEAEAQAVATHLAACAECAHRAELMRATTHAVAALPAPQLPRALDFDFVRATGQVRERPNILPLVRARATAWGAPALAAAAVVAVIVGLVGPSAVAPTTDGRLAERAGNAPTAVTGNDSTVKSYQGLTGAANPPAAAPGPAQAVPVPATEQVRVSKQFPSAGGLTVTVSAGSTSVRRGAATSVAMDAGGGSQDLRLGGDGLELILRGPGGDTLFATTYPAGGSLPTGQAIRLTGSVGAPDRAGEYTLVGRVQLADGSFLEATLRIKVT